MPETTLSAGAKKIAASGIKTIVKLDPAIVTKIVGPVAQKHAELGGEGGLLGAPKGDEQAAANDGRFREYAGGVVYWSPETGAHEVHGAILQLWTELGRERGFLGYPVTNELATADGVGRFSDFQGGQIAWSASLGAAVSSVFGAAFEDGHPGLKPLSHDHPEGESPQVRRRLSVGAAMQLTDHETFGSNEHGEAEQSADAVLTNDLPQKVLTLVDGAGGEMRVELVLTAKARTNGDVLVDGVANLWEGTSEQTDDHDGSETFQVLVPRDSFTSQNVQVRNEDEGDDFANIQMTFNNSAV